MIVEIHSSTLGVAHGKLQGRAMASVATHSPLQGLEAAWTAAVGSPWDARRPCSSASPVHRMTDVEKLFQQQPIAAVREVRFQCDRDVYTPFSA